MGNKSRGLGCSFSQGISVAICLVQRSLNALTYFCHPEPKAKGLSTGMEILLRLRRLRMTAMDVTVFMKSCT
jgi:hypothetical protein